MTLSDAWRVFHPELVAVTTSVWTDEDLDEPGRRELAADIDAGVLTSGVLDEVEHTLTADWCTGRVLTAALTVLAAHSRLEAFDPAAVTSRRPKTRVLLGTRYIVG